MKSLKNIAPVKWKQKKNLMYNELISEASSCKPKGATKIASEARHVYACIL